MPAAAHPRQRLVQHHRWTTTQTPKKLQEQLEALVYPSDEFQLVSKLSGAGIVVRVLQSPDTSLPFHGRVEPRDVALTLATRGRQMTPFQPIAKGSIQAGETGAQLDLTLRLPAGVSTLEQAGKILAGVLLLAAAPGLYAGVLLAWLVLPFAALCWFFPGLRARTAFAEDCRRTCEALQTALPELRVETTSDSTPAGR